MSPHPSVLCTADCMLNSSSPSMIFLFVLAAAVVLVFTCCWSSSEVSPRLSLLFLPRCCPPLAFSSRCWITRTTFNLSSFMGLIMVVGIVAKNGILLLGRGSEVSARRIISARCDDRGRREALTANHDDGDGYDGRHDSSGARFGRRIPDASAAGDCGNRRDTGLNGAIVDCYSRGALLLAKKVRTICNALIEVSPQVVQPQIDHFLPCLPPCHCGANSLMFRAIIEKSVELRTIEITRPRLISITTSATERPKARKLIR